MTNVKSSFRKTEKRIGIAGLFLAVTLTLVVKFTGRYEWESLIGYTLGIFSFFSLAEGFFLIEGKPKKYFNIFLVLTNLKLVILVGLIYLLHGLGISAIRLIIGMLLCQTLAVVTLLSTLYYDSHKPVANTDKDLVI